MGLLILSRRPEEGVVIDFSRCTDADLLALRNELITVFPTRFTNGTVKLGFYAPEHVTIDRQEVWIDKKKAVAAAMEK